MIANESKKASVLAYYLSKFDKEAVNCLGYETTSEAFEQLSKTIGKNNNYIKLRRDEFDVLTNSHRKGWHKREPAATVVAFHEGLKNYSFEELSRIVVTLIKDIEEISIPIVERLEMAKITSQFSEEEIELAKNRQDTSSKIINNQRLIKSRVFDNRIQNALKALYNFRCQICGERALETYGVDISEAHHINYFSLTANNDANNIMIVCPDHHRIIHKANPSFNKECKTFEFDNGRCEALKYNVHL